MVVTAQNVTSQVRIMAAYFAVGMSISDVCEKMEVRRPIVVRMYKDPYVKALVDKHTERLERGIINAAIVATFSTITRDNRVFVPPPPKHPKAHPRIKKMKAENRAGKPRKTT